MTKKEAITKTRERWEKLKPEKRNRYDFTFFNCELCIETEQDSWLPNCIICSWGRKYGISGGNDKLICCEFITKFVDVRTIAEATIVRDTVIGMLLWLEENA